MKIQKIVSMLLSFIFLIFTLGAVPVSAQPSDVGYVVSAAEENGNFLMDISLHHVSSLGGRLAIAFDTEKLEIADTSSLTNAVKQSGGATISSEGLDDSVLLSNEKGYVMFAWHASTTVAVNASASDVKIASIAFKIKDGVSIDDFNRNTVSLYYVNETMAHKWKCSAEIVTDSLVAYRNNDINDAYVCQMYYDYPNCDVVPIITYEAGINVTDYSGNPIRANVTFDNLQDVTNSSGFVSFLMENGIYAYRVSAEGYETKSGYLIIRDSDETVDVQLMSHAEIAADTADSISIGYADGDSSSSVTSSLVLPTEGEYGEVITWESSNENIVSSQGVVKRGDDDTHVTLTVTVSLGGAVESRSFDVTVKGRLSAEEKNAAIIAQDKQALEIRYAPGDSKNSVTSDIILPELGTYGCSIIWSSSREDIISEYGYVTRPSVDIEVKLTAMILRAGAHDTKEFTVTVKAETKQDTVSDEDIVNKVLSAVEIVYADGDSANSVTKNLTLMSQGAEETEIYWISSQPAVVTSYGGIVRQAADTKVTLTAKVSRGSVSKEKVFNVLVKAAPSIPLNPNYGQEEDIRHNNEDNSDSTPKPTVKPGTTPSPSATHTPTDTNAPSKERFNDIDSVPWAKEAILALAEKGVISGTSDTTYSPQNQIRRADFITLLVRMLKLDGEISESFDDVTKDKYYYETVSLAKSLGIISGVGDNKFNPEGSITRQDMMVMTYNALDKLNMADMPESDLSEFTDKNNVADYAYESVSHLVGAGYISGDNGNLNPKGNTTRAETAVFLYKLDKK